jgi:hypothetical protein
MANKKFFWGMLVMVLAFGITVTGCPTDTDDDGGGGDSALNGTWVSGSGSSQQELKLDNGNFEVSSGGISMMKGTYTAASGKLTIKGTHVHGSMFGSSGIESKWYSKDELKTAIKQAMPGITDEQFEESFSFGFTEQTGDYSVNGNTFTMTSGGQTTTYTRK